MSQRTTKNDIPDVNAIKAALLDVLAGGRSRKFELIGGDVSKALGLTRAQRSYRIGASKKTLFENRLVQARAELVKEGVISYKAGKVKLVKQSKSGPAARQAPDPKTDLGTEPQSESAVAPVPGDENAASQSAFAVHPNAPEGRPTKCLSFRQPHASYIATGVKTVEFRSKKAKTPIRDLVVCASKTVKRFQPLPGHAYGMAIGLVDVVECVGEGTDHAWKLENPRLIKPFEVKASAGFYYAANIPEVIPNTEEAYRKYVLPHCFRGPKEEEDMYIASLFSATQDELQNCFYGNELKFEAVEHRYRR